MLDRNREFPYFYFTHWYLTDKYLMSSSLKQLDVDCCVDMSILYLV